ncbi:hypothetical protein PS691_01312 [Pseudomonas fluorescens]|uniref:Uncharacterized protein n=1 Tax=Pseudomonas fluorescens TaxID=294 RepID=A0A5E7AW40_PSEFL|nr:hypothetical protein PS691_01312 [Pseudomonas fluorescens]
MCIEIIIVLLQVIAVFIFYKMYKLSNCGTRLVRA